MADKTPGGQSANAEGTSKAESFINTLAITIVVISSAVLLVLIIMAWWNLPTCEDCNKEGFANTKDLLSVFLPLIATWMGTILAFYFSKENFDNANRSVKTLVDRIKGPAEILEGLSVSDVMVRLDHSTLLTFANEEEFRKFPLSELLKKMVETHSERMPILEKDTLKFIFLIYRSTVERFILEVTAGKLPVKRQNVQPKDLIVNDMFESDFQIIKDIVALNFKDYFLPITATLDEVRKAMQDNTICQDVFITKTGNKDEAVQGWITNNMIVEKAELFRKSGSRI